MYKFHNVSPQFILLQPLDGGEVIPFPGSSVKHPRGSTLTLDEKQSRGNCRDLCFFLQTGQVEADDAAKDFVIEARDAFAAKQKAAADKARADRKG